MPPKRSIGVPHITGNSMEEMRQSIQFWMTRVYDHLDQMSGLRGTPTLFSSLDAQGNALNNVGVGQLPDDAVIKKQTITIQMNPENATPQLDAGAVGIFNLPAGDHPNDAVNLGQLIALLDQAGLALRDILTTQPYVTAVASSVLTAERVLTGESTVVTITDNGANTTIVVSLTANGVTDAKLRQGAATSVVGRSANSTGNVADIAASADTHVLRRAAGVLGFGQITIAYLSDYTEGSFTLTGAGFTVNPTATARWVRVGSQVTLFVPTLSGTSNNTSFNLTGLDAAVTPTQTSYHPVLIQDNGVTAFGWLRLNAGSTTVDLVPSAAGGASSWTNSGTKGIFSTWLSYALL